MRCSSYRKIEEYFFKSKLTSLFDLAEAKINLSGLTKIAFELQKEILENEQERFNIGLSKTNDVLEAQKELEQAELIYNKARQAAITQELSEIVSGAAAV